MTLVITEPLVRKLLATVDAGLVAGLGQPTPGAMCVEAAISYALGEPHSDGPSCVSPAVRAAKIRLNDAAWPSDLARARGMRRAAIAQLGSLGVVDDKRFAVRLAELVIREIVPLALRITAQRVPSHADRLEAAAHRCAMEGSRDATYAARAATYAAHPAARAAANAAANATAAANAAADAATAANATAAARAARAAANAADAATAANATAAAAYAAADAAANAANAAADAATAATATAARVSVLTHMADLIVRVLQEQGSPGCDWLWLCDEVAT
jgi:colicin import membrane protein